MKTQFEIEFLLKTSPKVLEDKLTTPSGLGEWFADKVTVNGNIYDFYWNGSSEKAELRFVKPGSKIQFKWLNDEGVDYFFEMHYSIDTLTNIVALKITDFAEEDDLEESKLVWEKSVQDLIRLLGAELT
ncbi:MAG: SRPBCC domain-containing protein [Bacteroidetes bacterium]|nr:SRPBCC domain-containing protein [Bacteroidota bacterium]